MRDVLYFSVADVIGNVSTQNSDIAVCNNGGYGQSIATEHETRRNCLKKRTPFDKAS